MKLRTFFSISVMAAAALFYSSCENDDTDFDDFDYTTAYFAYQTPIRTLVLGNSDVVDVSSDNAHEVNIYAVVGGTRNGISGKVNVQLAPELCEDLYFSDGTPVQVMPSSYYTMESNTISISGINGSVKVSLSDAFFEDENAIKNTYVIPLVITDVAGIDSVLRGSSVYDNPNRLVSSDWDTTPQDYCLYLVKFICPWAGNYLRRGVDVTTTGGTTTTNTRHTSYIETDEVYALTTTGLHQVSLTATDGTALLLTFDDNGNGTISSDTDGFTATGSATFVEKGAAKAWGNTDRDVIYMDYAITGPNYTVAVKDTLVARDRGVTGTAEEFSYTYTGE